MIIAGAGGVGRETLDACSVAGIRVSTFVDDGLAGGVVGGVSVLSTDDLPPDGTFVVAVGSPATRETMAQRLLARGLTPGQVVHPRAIVGGGGDLGPGAIVFGGAHVSIAVRAGTHLQVHYNATIGHDCVLGDRVTVLPGANVGGSVTIEDDATIGTGAVVLQNLRIGRHAFVGAGAVVVRDVPAGAIVVGVPARPVRHRD